MGRYNKARPPLDALVRDLYGTLAEETRFERSLHLLGAHFRSHISALHSEEFAAQRGQYSFVGDVTAGEYQQLTVDYTNRWNGQNLWMLRSLPGFLRQGFEHGDAVVSDAEFQASSYYRHVLKPLDIRRGLAICLWNDESMNMAVASFHRGHADVGFSEDDLALIRQLRPHLVNAYAIHRRFAKLQFELGSLRTAFDRAPIGMLLLDSQGRVLESNACSDRLLRGGQGLTLGPNNALRFSSTALRLRMAETIKRLVASAKPLPESLLIRSGDGERIASGLVMHLCAVPDAIGGILHGRGRILAFIAELQPQQRETLNCYVLQHTFGLTRAEARAALALRECAEVGAAARMLGVAPATVRSQVKSIFRKLGVHQYGELLLLVERLVISAP